MIRRCASRAAAAAFLSLSLLTVTTAVIAQHRTQAGALVIEAPWTRATPGGAKVAGGFLKITNTGTTPDRLIGGTLPLATSVEVHEMSMTEGIMRMRRLEKGLEIAPGASVELKPGSYHMMFMGLSEGLVAGGTIKGTLVFDKAGTVEVEYRIAPIGSQPAPKHGH
jgi:periplasmic copper chaperone A